MSILDFSFTDHQTRWKLKEIHFQPSINLLVGLSGAGKSMTLQWLATTCLAAIDPDYVPRNCEWSITLSIDGDRYRWAARTTVEGDVNAEEAGGVVADLGDSAFTSESITVNDERLLDRTATSLTLHGEHLPDLPRDASAIGLLRRDPRLAPLARALRHVRLSYQDLLRRDIRVDGLTFARGRHSDHHSLAALAAIPLLLPLKAYVLQEHLPADFKRLILDPYRDIFPSVEAIRVDLASNLFPNIPVQRRRNGDLIDVAIREHDVPTWIGSEDLSSGMHQTLVHLLELALSPPGTVLLIDEYENSMGINCLPAVTEHILERAGDLQFIITSHHPYVINNVDKRHWMVVRRRGSVVEVVPASAIPSLDTHSSQDAFIQLMNAEEYRGSIESWPPST
jgi:hypothetical protein